MDPTDGEQACFEAGVKFGTLYHQFAGTPISPESAESLARAIEEAIENQPFCADVTVEMHHDRLREALAEGPGDSEYVELTGRFMDVRIVVERDGVRVRTRMTMQDGYPLMEVVDVANL